MNSKNRNEFRFRQPASALSYVSAKIRRGFIRTLTTNRVKKEVNHYDSTPQASSVQTPKQRFA